MNPSTLPQHLICINHICPGKAQLPAQAATNAAAASAARDQANFHPSSNKTTKTTPWKTAHQGFQTEMSHRSTRSQEDLAGINKADLYRTPPPTRRRIKTKSISRTPSTSDTEQEGKEQQENSSPIDRFIDQTPKTSTMAESAAQAEIRRLQQQLAQAEAALTEQSDSVNPEKADRMRQHSVNPEEAERIRQHEIQLRRQEEEENNRARYHELEIARLQL
jgi:hypothetical protein